MAQVFISAWVSLSVLLFAGVIALTLALSQREREG
jgi:hypothetical protein